MKNAQLIATPQFDSGRWKLRLERAPISNDNQFIRPVVSGAAIGFTMLSPLVFLVAAYSGRWLLANCVQRLGKFRVL